MYSIKISKNNFDTWLKWGTVARERALVPCRSGQKGQTWKTREGASKVLYCGVPPEIWRHQAKKKDVRTYYKYFHEAEGYQVEIIGVKEAPVQPTPQQRWDASHPEVIKESKAKYDADNPILSFRPTPEILEWLEEERWDNETNAALLKRKLEKLRQLECQGY